MSTYKVGFTDMLVTIVGGGMIGLLLGFWVAR